jgi:CBS domain containing-hemolysin-like protein
VGEVTTVYLLILVALLLLNAFFVLAEFALVKIRGTQIDALEKRGVRRATSLRHIHEHIDEYLAVCQLGITFASIGLGFVGEPAIAKIIRPWLGSAVGAHAVAITVSYVIISFLHILIGELVPKSLALRITEPAALWTAPGMRFFRTVLYLPLKVMNGSALLLLRLFRLPASAEDSAPSEAEIRLILNRSQQDGMMPFRRLLLLENVFDFGEARVKDEMRPWGKVAALHLDRTWEENRAQILKARYSRFPLVEGTPPRPVGVLHLKDMLNEGVPWPDPVDLRAIMRKTHVTTRDTPLEQLLTDLRRRRVHMALVQDEGGALVGLITLEDILEQLVGAIEDEFERETPLRLGDVLSETRVHMRLTATRDMEAIAEIIQRTPAEELPAPAAAIIEAVQARERSLSTYLGRELAVPHARLVGMERPVVFAARSEAGIRFGEDAGQRATLIFLLLTPAHIPRMQIQLLARIAALCESPYVWERVLSSASPTELMEAIRGSDEMLGE